MRFKLVPLVCLMNLALSSVTFAQSDSNCSPKADPCFYAQLEILRKGKWCIEESKGAFTYSCMTLGDSASITCKDGYKEITPSEQADLEQILRKNEIDRINQQKAECMKKEENLQNEASAAVS